MRIDPVVKTVTSDRPEVIADLDGVFVSGTMRFDGDRYRLVRVEFILDEHKHPDGEITATTLRRLEVSRFAREGRQVLVHWLQSQARETPEMRAEPSRLIPAISEAEARRRIKAASRTGASNSALDDAFYRRVALDLVELVESGKRVDGGILAALAEIEARRLKRDVPIETLRTWIRIARERKFLAPGVRGRMNAQPGRLLYGEEGS